MPLSQQNPLDLRPVEAAQGTVDQEHRQAVYRRPGQELGARTLLGGQDVGLDEAVQGADRLTEAVTLFALLELYKAGEAKWEQEVPFGPITVVPPG